MPKFLYTHEDLKKQFSKLGKLKKSGKSTKDQDKDYKELSTRMNSVAVGKKRFDKYNYYREIYQSVFKEYFKDWNFKKARKMANGKAVFEAAEKFGVQPKRIREIVKEVRDLESGRREKWVVSYDDAYSKSLKQFLKQESSEEAAEKKAKSTALTKVSQKYRVDKELLKRTVDSFFNGEA